MRISSVLTASAIGLLLACGGGGGDGGGTGPSSVLTSVQVSPSTPTVAVNGTAQLSASPLDQNGAAISGLTATFTSSDANKASVNSSTGLVTGVATGTATITASFTSGSITKSGTSTVTVVPAGSITNVTANTALAFVPPDVTINAGSTVSWIFQSVQHSVIFDSGPAVPGGNIGVSQNTTVSRTFTAPGTYNYHCGVHGAIMSGSVTVH